jgi:TPR repeat protein
VSVLSVQEDSLAAKLGIVAGDVLVEFRGQTLRKDLAHFVNLVAASTPGETLDLTLLRQGERMTVRFTFDSPPQPATDVANASPDNAAASRLTLEADADQASAECRRVVALSDAGVYNPAAASAVCREAQFKSMRVAAELGDAESQYVVGSFYQLGTGVAQDDREAVSWYRRAVEQDYGDAHWGLGLMYQDGKGGLPHDSSLIVHHLMRALWRKSALARTGLIENQGAQLTDETRTNIVLALEGLGYNSGRPGEAFDSNTLAALEDFAASEAGEQPTP